MDILPKQTLVVSGITSIIVITCFLSIVAAGIVMLVLVYQKRQLQYMRDKEQLKVSYEKEILESKLEIQEQTLKTISQEVHDNIGQVLSLAKLNINTMAEATPELLTEKIDDCRNLISKAIQDLRDISKSLNTDYVSNMGLLKAIEHELNLIQKTTTLKLDFVIHGETFRFNHQVELIVFRIVQEALHNIIKHAQASLVQLKLDYETNLFKLTIADNGIGLKAVNENSKDYNSMGLGIRNMNNRATLINASFSITNNPQGGTTLILELPVNNNLNISRT